MIWQFPSDFVVSWIGRQRVPEVSSGLVEALVPGRARKAE